MKRDEIYADMIRREIDQELSFLDDCPSLHCDIMRQVKGEKTMKKKITVGFVFALILLLATVAALAVSLLNGFVFADQPAHGEAFACAVHGGRLHVLGNRGLWEYDADGLQAQQVLPRNALPRYVHPLQAELVAGETLMLMDRASDRIWSLQQEGFELLADYSDTPLAAADDSAADIVAHDGMLFLQSDDEGAVYRADPSSGAVEKMAINNVRRLVSYRDGQLLALTYTPSQGTAIIAVDTRDARVQQLYATPDIDVKGICYSMERQRIYAMVGGRLSVWRDADGWYPVCGVALPEASFFQGAFGNTYAAVSHEGIRFIPLDGTDAVQETLIIRGLHDYARYDHEFQQEVMGVTVVRKTETDFDINAALQVLAADEEVDLLHVRLCTTAAHLLWEKVQPLDSDALRADVGQMLPAAQSLATNGGVLYALPSSIVIEGWTADGAPQNRPPATLLQLFHEQTYVICEDMFVGTQPTTVPWDKRDLAAYLIRQRLRERRADGVGFTDPVFVDTLEALKNYDPFDGDAVAWRHTYVSLAGYLGGSDGVIAYTAPPVVEATAQLQIPAYVNVYVLNPNSEHKQLAMRYLEHLAANRAAGDDALLKPAHAQPVLGEWAQANAGTADAWQSSIAQDPQSWEVLEQNLDRYREGIAPFIVIDDDHAMHQMLAPWEEAMVQTVLQCLDGDMSPRQCAQQLEVMVQQ